MYRYTRVVLSCLISLAGRGGPARLLSYNIYKQLCSVYENGAIAVVVFVYTASASSYCMQLQSWTVAIIRVLFFFLAKYG